MGCIKEEEILKIIYFTRTRKDKVTIRAMQTSLRDDIAAMRTHSSVRAGQTTRGCQAGQKKRDLRLLIDSVVCSAVCKLQRAV